MVLTREQGKNGQLMQALQQRGISVLEMPLVETLPGPDRDSLPEALQQGDIDWVVITSPEAAAVFLRGWESAGRPQVLPFHFLAPSLVLSLDDMMSRGCAR